MSIISSIEELEKLYGEPVPAAVNKLVTHITPLYRQWIEASRFLILATVGPDGTDASPRGDAGPVVKIRDKKTILLPDWRGNNRIDSLRNIIRDNRVSLMFMVPRCNNVVRINGKAVITADKALRLQFQKGEKQPQTILQVTIHELYFQCAKALMRSKLWETEDESMKVPTAGQFIREKQPDFDNENYDKDYADYAKNKMW